MTDGTGATSYAYVPVGTRGALRVASVDGPLTTNHHIRLRRIWPGEQSVDQWCRKRDFDRL